MAKSLLDKAKESKAKKATVVTMEHVELALAFINGEITANQMSTVSGATTANAYFSATSILRRAKEMGLIKGVKCYG